MKRLFALLAALTALAAIVGGSAVAGGSAAKKVNGDIWFQNDGYAAYGIPNPPGLAHWVLNAQEATANSPVKGTMTYEDGYGSYTAKVTDVTFESHGGHQDATITAVFTTDNHDYVPGVGITDTWTVHDVAEPGVGQDYFTHAGLDSSKITAGNIQVHS